jgi:hypothetical protein
MFLILRDLNIMKGKNDLKTHFFTKICLVSESV